MTGIAFLLISHITNIFLRCHFAQCTIPRCHLSIHIYRISISLIYLFIPLSFYISILFGVSFHVIMPLHVSYSPLVISSVPISAVLIFHFPVTLLFICKVVHISICTLYFVSCCVFHFSLIRWICKSSFNWSTYHFHGFRLITFVGNSISFLNDSLTQFPDSHVSMIH